MTFRRFIGPTLCTLLATPAILFSQAAAPAATDAPAAISPSDSLGAVLSLTQTEVVSAAEAMPADKYDFAPPATAGEFKGVRTFGEQVKHLAQANYQLLKGTGVPGAIDPKSLDGLKSKDDLIKALKDSYAYAHMAVNSLTPANAFNAVSGFPPQFKATNASMVTFMIMHTMDHYGQMVEYLRMNGIIPPASRPGAGSM
jgi:uncharacterized damage-inducible protein DinB